MTLNLRWWPLCAFAIVACAPLRSEAGLPATSPTRPLQTELLGPLDLSHVKEGTAVLLRVDRDWTGTGCSLQSGSVVQGRVVHFEKRGKGQNTSAIHLLFDTASCDGVSAKPFPFTLVALVGPVGGTSQTGQSGVSEASPLADAPGLGLGGSGPGGGLRSLATASNTNTFSILPARSLPPTILPGQVVDIARTNLSVGTGQQGATVISAIRKDVRLEASTSFVLIPTVVTSPVVGSGAGASASKPDLAGGNLTSAGAVSAEGASASGGMISSTSASRPTASESLDETEVCSTSCNAVETSGPAIPGATLKVASLPIRSLGYGPHDLAPKVEFGDETTLTYLDADNLLCTFDPHHLRARAAAREEEARDVRAVLIDPKTRQMKRVVQWHVRGSDRYLWPLSDGRVLVHIGRELRLFGPELQALRSVAVNGPVAYVVSSPSSDHIVVGMLQVRYSEAVYRQLQETLAEAPEEAVEVRVFDRELKLMAVAQRSSKAAVPVLSDDGELRLTRENRSRWRLSEFRWDRTEHVIATVKSECRPTLSTPEHGLTFAVGCTSSGGRWYRMLRADGRPLLKGESTSDEIAQAAQGTIAGSFAVRVVKTGKPMTYSQPFNRLDLLSEQIGIYRLSDGATLGTVTTNDFALAARSFALSPSGNLLALIGKDSVAFYPVKVTR